MKKKILSGLVFNISVLVIFVLTLSIPVKADCSTCDGQAVVIDQDINVNFNVNHIFSLLLKN